MRSLRSAILLLVAAAPLCAGASEARLVEARDGAVIRVSASEPNLIEAGHGRITAFVFAEGKFVQTVDADSGVVYFRPLEEGPRSGFVEVEAGAGQRRRFGLVMIPDPNWPAQRIVLQDRAAGLEASERAAEPPETHVPAAADHVASVKSMMRALLDGRGVELDGSRERTVVGSLLLERQATRTAGGLVGELHRMSNTGGEPLLIDEAGLHLGDDVIAVALASRRLRPGAASEAYLVRQAASGEGGL